MNIKILYPLLKYNIEIKGITNNSLNVGFNYIFVAIDDGVNYINDALKKGAIFIVTNLNIISDRFIIVDDVKKEYIRLLQLFYKYDTSINLIGVTGTNGKTTTSYILSEILNKFEATSYIGTNGIQYLGTKKETINTTPSSEIIYKTLSYFKDLNIKNCVMETSSEGIINSRIEGLHFHGAIYTNLSHEHLNTHKTMMKYFLAKAKLFEHLNSDAIILINSDDKYAKYIHLYTKAHIITYGFNHADYRIIDYKLKINGSSFTIINKNKVLGKFYTNLFGKYNIYNAVAAISYATELGIDAKTIQSALSNIESIDGRFMYYKSPNDITAIVDFAHTPKAIDALLSNISIFKKRKIILVMGSQGEKDKSKRKYLANVASLYADNIIITSEDPKCENLFSIIYDITKNLKTDYYIEPIREKAILLAARLAKSGDIIVIVGKGNENYEKILNYKFKHNDYEIIKEALQF